jgi:hypothetical protein
MKWAGHVALVGEMRNTYEIMVRNHETKIPLKRPTPTWEDNIKLDLKETGWESIKRIHLAQNRNQYVDLVNMGSIKFREFLNKLSNYQLTKKDTYV